MKIHFDQLGRKVALAHPPHRIVSLVPSQTELLFDLGLEEKIVGITRFCVHPPRRDKTFVGGTKDFDTELIMRLTPDLIIANKEENTREKIELLAEHIPVWVSDVKNLESALEMILSIGELCDKVTQAQELVAQIRLGFSQLYYVKTFRVLYFIWRKPYMVAGKDTFIHDILARIGCINLCPLQRYPALSPEEIIKLDPEIIFLSSEPYPFKTKHVKEIQEIVPKASVRLVNGEFFSWYGSRLALAAPYLVSLRHSLNEL